MSIRETSLELMSEMDVREARLAELRMQAEHARRRLDLYRARSYGMKPISESRMRDLVREAEAADARLRHARQQGSTA